MTVLDRIEALSDDLKLYFNTNIELVKLQALDRSSTLGASVISGLIIAVIVLLFVVFASLALALYLSVLLGAYYFGFGVLAGFYLLVGFILFATRKQILEDPIRDTIVSNAVKNDGPNKQD